MSETKLKATKGRLLLKEIEVENKTEGGILLTTQAQDTSNTILCEVIDCDETQLTGVTKVFIGKHAGSKITHKAQKFISVSETEIVAYLSAD